MSFLGGDRTGAGSRPCAAGADWVLERKRRATRDGVLGTGTIACPRCDAPVAIGPEPVVVTTALRCPFCGHRGPVRAFLSLRRPTRPTRVTVALTVRGER